MPIPPLNKPATMSQRLGFQDPDLTTPEHDAMVFWTKKYLKNYCAKIVREKPDLSIEGLTKKVNYLEEKFIKLNRKSTYSADEVQDFESFGKKINIFNQNERHTLNRCVSYGTVFHEWFKLILDLLPERFKLLYQILEKDWCIEFDKDQCSDITLEKPIEKESGYKNSYSSILGYADIYAKSRKGHVCFTNSDDGLFGITSYLTDYDEADRTTLSDGKLLAYVEVKPRIQSFGELLRQIRTYETVTGKGNWYVACPDTRFKDDLEDEGVKFIQITEDYKDYL